jgi:prepilin-type N-terminal cleavage/methylation domain-containing protein
LRHSRALKSNTDGFTLIEVLIALSIVAIALTSIGALMASSARGVRSIESRVMRAEIARSTLTALPDRSQLKPGYLSGRTSGHDWRVDVQPYVTPDRRPTRSSWRPHMVAVTVRSPAGVATQINTVRLRWSDGG